MHFHISKVTLSDKVARDKIVNCLDQTYLVEAGAGSGKTASLVQRMIALLAAGECGPENIAAVTFTHKAAGELKERFQVKLEERLQAEQDQSVRERLTVALEKIERIFIGTIHSFCARLLRERPIEAGIAPDFQEIEELEGQLLEEEAWEQYLVEVGANNPLLLDRLEQLDLSYSDLQEAFSTINLYPDVQILKQKTSLPDLSAARSRLDRFMKLALPLVPATEPDAGWDDLQSRIRTAKRWDDFFNLKDDLYFYRLLEQLNKSGDATYYRWQQDKDVVKHLEEEYADFRENYLIPALEAWYAYRHYEVVEFIEPASRQYREMRRRENMLNFQDLLMLTADLLKNNGEVRGYFQECFSHLLIDEFQDTDPIQAEIIFYLAGDDCSEQDWTKLKPRPGALFVVGDPKQSIFRFRRADIATYDRVKQLIRISGGEVLTLSTNFRSLPALIDFSNEAFADLFSSFAPPYQAEFAVMDQYRPGGGSYTEGLLKIEVDAITRHKQEEIARQDAEKVAGWIAGAIEGGIRLRRSEDEIKAGCTEKAEAGDFLVIVSKKLNLSLYAQALEAWGIPFTVSGGSDLKESKELGELLSLLQALADPDNPVPLVATLRGAFYGLSDDLLYRFKQAGGQFYIFKPVPKSADQGVKDHFELAWEDLLRFHVFTKHLLPSSAIEKIAEQLGLIPYALAGELGRGRAGSIMQALELLRSRENRGLCSFRGAVDYLERLLQDGVDVDLAIDGGSVSAVRIINLHKAKGLEAPVVILANPGNHKVYDPSLHVARAADRAEGYLVIDKVIDSYGNRKILATPPQWDDKKVEEEKYRDSEYVRLLYVAATRAKNLLLISTYKGNFEKSPWHPLEEFLDAHNCREAFSIFSPPASTAVGAAPGAAIEPIDAVMKQAAAEEISVGFSKIAGPTYQHIIGAELHSGEELPARQSRGRGTAWGTAVHAALDYLVSGIIANQAGSGGGGVRTEDLQQAVERAALEAELSVTQKDELQQLLESMVASAFWQRISAATDLMSEIPFGSWEGKNYSTGIVDLAFRENGGWVLVDYKSDSIEDYAHRQALVEHYRPQLDFYRINWEKITGEKVTECALFFTDKLFYAEL